MYSYSPLQCIDDQFGMSASNCWVLSIEYLFGSYSTNVIPRLWIYTVMEIDKPGLLKVVSPHLEIRSVSTGVRQAKLNLAGSSSSSNVTYCDVSRVPSSNSLVIDVVDHTTKEKNIRIYVPLSVERQLKRRGWDALMVQQQRGIRSRRRVCAYRLFVGLISLVCRICNQLTWTG